MVREFRALKRWSEGRRQICRRVATPVGIARHCSFVGVLLARLSFLATLVLPIVSASSNACAQIFTSLAPLTAGEFAARYPVKTIFSLQPIASAAMRPSAERDRVVLIHFFATWCEPCKQELASLQRLSASLLDHNVAIIGVDVGGNALRSQRFLPVCT